MAELVSPGVQVSVIDESFYAAAGTGTVPFILIATAQDKVSPDGSGTAAFTTSAEAGKVKLITSQRELLTNFGNPNFESVGSNPSHGDELNEYGLFAAYSFLGIANRAYVVRADVDLGSLTPLAAEPAGPATAGSHWLDTADSVWGLKRFNGTKWVRQSVLAPGATDVDGASVPKASYGATGDFAVVYFDDAGATLSEVRFYEKFNAADWEVIGSTPWRTAKTTEESIDQDFQILASTAMPPATQSDGGAVQTGDLILQINSANNGTDIDRDVVNGANGIIQVNLAADDPSGNPYYSVQTDPADANATVNAFAVDDIVRAIQHAISAGDNALTEGDDLTVTQSGGSIQITSASGYDIRIVAGSGGASTVTEAELGFLTTPYTNWEALSFTASPTALTGTPADGQVWYDYRIDEEAVDLLVNDAVTDNWISYTGTVQIAASEPDVSLYTAGDIWVDSADLENYPSMYKLSAGSEWVALDTSDQESEDGVLFADARVSSAASLDADAPDADLYPYGMLLWNLRGSGGNVKEYKVDYTVDGVLIGDRWVGKGGNAPDGGPALLRKAQRNVVIQAMSAAVNSNEDLRNESNRFNLMAAPGYPELLDEMNTLNVDRKLTAFIIGDSPLRLKADGTSLQNWATNTAGALQTSDAGLVSPGGEQAAYMAIYYPHGSTTNLDGSNVVVPSSHIILRTMAFNDQVAFPWFAPAGFQRGVVTNAASVGYVDVDNSNEFVPVSLSEGQRDTLYANKVNPIGQFPGRGLAVFGQKTLYPNASALDRVNVGRLIVYIRERLDDIVKPFLFEPNDEITRQNAKVVVDRFLGNLVSQRGLYDFLTVCDTTNNTPSRIDRNELYIDVAIQPVIDEYSFIPSQPVKSIEFIYIPVRVQNTLGSTG